MKGIIVIIFILFVIWLLSITAFSDKTNNNDKLDNKEETKDIFKDNLSQQLLSVCQVLSLPHNHLMHPMMHHFFLLALL